MSIAMQRLQRAIDNMPRGIRAGVPKVVIDYPDAERIMAELALMQEQVKQLSMLCLAYEDKMPFPAVTREIFGPILKARKFFQERDSAVAEAAYLQCAKDFNVLRSYCNGYSVQQMAEGYANQVYFREV